MNKIFLVWKREYISRVKKKSFLIVTLLVPILFPSLIGGIVYFGMKDMSEGSAKVIEYIDETGQFDFKNTGRFSFIKMEGDTAILKKAYLESEHYGLLHITSETYILFNKKSPSMSELKLLESAIEEQLREQKINELNLSEEIVKDLRPDINLRPYNLIENKENNSKVSFVIGNIGGFLIYIFLFIYGAQVMQSVIEEKSNKIVEIIVSSVRPFQLMMGKVLGIAAVGLTQFFIWIVLFVFITGAIFGYLGISGEQIETAASSNQAISLINTVTSLPIAQILFIFGFYFIGGFLLYGSLFAAIGSAVDTPSEAQQFMLPITLPLIVSMIGLSMVLENPDGQFSFWLSVIPFTSPVVMMGRIGFGFPPIIELIASMLLLVLGFIFTIWLAGRIYRIGILTSGTKINYKILVKWLMMKN